MPSGRTHDFITIVSAAAGTPAVLDLNLPDNNPTNSIVLMGAYLLSGLIFSPDLDLRSAPYRRWRMFRFIWKPYQWMAPHRSWVSHSFLLGPIIRVLYFAAVMALLALGALALLNLLTPIDPTGTLLAVAHNIEWWMRDHPSVVGYALAGFVLGGAAHTLADVIYSWVKRRV